MKAKGIKTGEFLYGVLALVFGYQTLEDILMGEILSQSTGSLKVVLTLIFALIVITGFISLIDFVCRLFGSTFVDVANEIIEWVRDRF